MKRNVGTTFVFDGKEYLVKKRETLYDCDKCAFSSCSDCARHHMNISGECCGETRGDWTDVYFVENQTYTTTL